METNSPMPLCSDGPRLYNILACGRCCRPHYLPVSAFSGCVVISVSTQSPLTPTSPLLPSPPSPPTPCPSGSAIPRICSNCLWALLLSPLSPCLCFLWLSGGICYHSISRYRKAAWALGPHTKDKSSFHPIHA